MLFIAEICVHQTYFQADMFLLSTYLRIKVISRVKLTYTLLYAKWSKTSHRQCFNSLRNYPCKTQTYSRFYGYI